jgi:hypothetical protein
MQDNKASPAGLHPKSPKSNPKKVARAYKRCQSTSLRQAFHLFRNTIDVELCTALFQRWSREQLQGLRLARNYVNAAVQELQKNHSRSLPKTSWASTSGPTT